MSNSTFKYLILFTGVWANTLIALYTFANYQNQIIFWQTLARLSGRVSLFLFAALFINETLKLYKPANASQSSIFEEKNIFTAFAFHHFIHLIFLTLFLFTSQAEVILYRLAGGALAYTLILMMPILYFFKPEMVRKPLKIIYLYYVWFIMFMTYIARVQGKLAIAGGTMQEHLTFFSIVILLLLFNLFYLLKWLLASQKPILVK